MGNITLKIEATELAEAINNLANAIKGTVSKDVTDISETDIVKLPNGEDPEKYTMFNDMVKVAQELRDLDQETYEGILYKYVDEGRKYSAIEACDWGKATKDFKKAIKDLKSKKEGKSTIEDHEEVEEETAYTLGEVRALAAKAKNAGVKVGSIMKEMTGVTKMSEVKESKYTALVDALKEALEELED